MKKLLSVLLVFFACSHVFAFELNSSTKISHLTDALKKSKMDLSHRLSNLELKIKLNPSDSKISDSYMFQVCGRTQVLVNEMVFVENNGFTFLEDSVDLSILASILLTNNNLTEEESAQFEYELGLPLGHLQLSSLINPNTLVDLIAANDAITSTLEILALESCTQVSVKDRKTLDFLLIAIKDIRAALNEYEQLIEKLAGDKNQPLLVPRVYAKSLNDFAI